ncbi:MAG: hypothetical protein AAF804_12855 [Bacteroidota bacterium]
MRQLTIRSNNEAALKKLEEFLRFFNFEIIYSELSESAANPPITYAQQPNFRAMAGIWEGRKIEQDSLRRDAWGDRV